MQYVEGNVRPLPDRILVVDMEEGERVVNGIILLDDDGKDTGIRPRWSRVWKVGDDIDDIIEDQWILVDHGRWTRGIKIRDDDGDQTMRMIERGAILLVSDESPR